MRADVSIVLLLITRVTDGRTALRSRISIQTYVDISKMQTVHQIVTIHLKQYSY